MKYRVPPEGFLNLMVSRPALVKTMLNATEETYLACLDRNNECYLYMPENIKTSFNIVMKYMSGRKYHWNNGCIDNVPAKFGENLTEDQRARVMENIPASVLKITATRDELLTACRRGFLACQYVNKFGQDFELLEAQIDYISQGGENRLYEIGHHIREFFDVPNPNRKEMAEKLITLLVWCAVHIPLEFFTPKILEILIAKKFTISRQGDELFPEDILSPEIITGLISYDRANIAKYIPNHLFDEKHCIILAESNQSWDLIPIKSKDVLMARLYNGCGPYPKDIEEYKDINFLYKTIETGLSLIMHYRNIGLLPDTEENICRFIKIDSNFLKNIAREDQTDNMIIALIESCTSEQIDALADNISLTRIKKEYVPLLVGCKDERLIARINTLCIGNASAELGGELEIETTPKEYKRIRQDILYETGSDRSQWK